MGALPAYAMSTTAGYRKRIANESQPGYEPPTVMTGQRLRAARKKTTWCEEEGEGGFAKKKKRGA